VSLRVPNRRTAVAAAVALTAGFVVHQASGAYANHTPADKPFAAATNLTKFGPGLNQTILTATVKNSKTTDMMLLLSLECSILTQTILPGGSNISSQSARAEGTIRAWIEIDGQTVPIVSQSSPPQTPTANTPNNENGKVTMCNRVYERTVADREGPMDGLDSSEDYIDTKDSNAFNWVRLNMGSGTHTITVKADVTVKTAGVNGGTGVADAYIGNRSLIGIPGKYANDATISEAGTG
jgi:hypothetical protein